jgi:hypothetical protein
MYLKSPAFEGTSCDFGSAITLSYYKLKMFITNFILR